MTDYELNPYQASQTPVIVHLFFEIPVMQLHSVKQQLQAAYEKIQDRIPILKSTISGKSITYIPQYHQFIQIPREQSVQDSMNAIHSIAHESTQTNSISAYFSLGNTTYIHLLANHAICDLMALITVAQDLIDILGGKCTSTRPYKSIPDVIDLQLGLDTQYDLNEDTIQFTLSSGHNDQFFKIVEFTQEETDLVSKFCKLNQISNQVFYQLCSIQSKSLILEHTSNSNFGMLIAANLTKSDQFGSFAESIVLQFKADEDFIQAGKRLTYELHSMVRDAYNPQTQAMRNRKYNGQLLALEKYFSDYTSNVGRIELKGALDVKFGAMCRYKIDSPTIQLHCGILGGKLFGVFSTNEKTCQVENLSQGWRDFVIQKAQSE